MKTPKTTSEAKWLPGALALAAVGAATHANAATVQITFTGSYISTTGGETAGNHLDTDFGDDGVANLRGSHSNTLVRLLTAPGSGFLVFAADRDPGRGFIYFIGGTSSSKVGVAHGVSFAAISFSEMDVRGGLPTSGYLQIAATSIFAGEKRLEVQRLIFDDATGGTIAGLNVNNAAFTEFSAVPEPSSLGLLALGAGGLLARRRRVMAA